MRLTNELIMRGEQANLQRLLERVESRLRDGWKRDREVEERAALRGVPGWWAYCFKCTARADRPAVCFFIHARSSNELSVSDVIALQHPRLSVEESHRVLVEFEREFLGPAAAEVGVETEVVQHRLTVEHDLSWDGVRLLRAFSDAANRNGLKPIDRRRWNAFLVRVHQDESIVDPALLDEWLQEHGWHEDTRCQLLAEYELSRSLLLVYDEEAQKR
jgi:hypothetical protein